MVCNTSSFHTQDKRCDSELVSPCRLYCSSKNSSSDVKFSSEFCSAVSSGSPPCWSSPAVCWLMMNGQFASIRSLCSLALLLRCTLSWRVRRAFLLANQTVAMFAPIPIAQTATMQMTATTPNRPGTTLSLLLGPQSGSPNAGGNNKYWGEVFPIQIPQLPPSSPFSSSPPSFLCHSPPPPPFLPPSLSLSLL